MTLNVWTVNVIPIMVLYWYFISDFYETVLLSAFYFSDNFNKQILA